MKQCTNRILSFVLIVSVFIASFLYPSIPVFAKPYYSWEELQKDATTSIFYIVSQLKAVANGSFADYVQGLGAWENYWNEDNVTVDDSGNVGYSEDLITLIKQALIDYSEETNGYYLIKTATPASLDLQQFDVKSLYTILNDLVNQYGLIGANMYSGWELNVCKFDGFYEKGYSFVFENSAKAWAEVYNSEWQKKVFQTYRSKQSTDSDGDSTYSLLMNNDYAISSSATHFHPSYIRAHHGTLYDPSVYYLHCMCLISSDGRTVRVFSSLDALKAYSLNKRTVYFAKDFYDTTPTQITVSFDDMQATVDKLDDVLNDLQSKIDDTSDESTIEDLLQQILDEMKNQGGGGGGNQGGNEGGNEGGGESGGGSYDDTGLLATLSGYFDSVLAKLDAVLAAIESLVWIEVDDSTVTEGDKDLFDLIDKIWENPETGSQEAADMLSGSFLDIVKGMTKKFPFSIPWDIHALFSVFARAGQSQPETVVLDDGYGIMPLVGEPDDGEYDYPNGDGTSTVVKWDENPHDAPYFVLPLVIESYGIEEYVEIDLKDFQTVSTLSRSLLAVLFAVFLIKFTITLMEFFGGGD